MYEQIQHICQICKVKNLDAIREEVDIGVGIQTHILYYECEIDGPIENCYSCGIPKDGRRHWGWCSELVK
jgi:hypothetical protein